MAKKKKGELPSGNIRIQVFDYTDENGKKHYKSFTARTKAEAQALATEWKNNRRELKDISIDGFCMYRNDICSRFCDCFNPVIWFGCHQMYIHW